MRIADCAFILKLLNFNFARFQILHFLTSFQFFKIILRPKKSHTCLVQNVSDFNKKNN